MYGVKVNTGMSDADKLFEPWGISRYRKAGSLKIASLAAKSVRENSGLLGCNAMSFAFVLDFSEARRHSVTFQKTCILVQYRCENLKYIVRSKHVVTLIART
jgi:hypothetical protein